MIIYKFDIPNFFAAMGYSTIHVVNGELRLDAEPDAATQALIAQYDGVRQPAAAGTTKAKKYEEVSDDGSTNA